MGTEHVHAQPVPRTQLGALVVRVSIEASREPSDPHSLPLLCRDPIKCPSAVSTKGEPYTQENGNYLDINKKMDGQSLKQHLMIRYLQYWTQTYQALPAVSRDGAAQLHPLDDPKAIPVPPSDDSSASP